MITATGRTKERAHRPARNRQLVSMVSGSLRVWDPAVRGGLARESAAVAFLVSWLTNGSAALSLSG
jgi:hypothetical protein